MFVIKDTQCASVSGGYEVLDWQPGPNSKAWSWQWSTRLGGVSDYTDAGTTMWYECSDLNDLSTCEFEVEFNYSGKRSKIWN